MTTRIAPSALLLVGVLVLATIVVVLWANQPAEQTQPASVVLAAGDIAECDRDQQEDTAAVLGRIPGPILGLGDYAYDDGTPEEYEECFDPSWGLYRDRIRPARGNHEGDGYLPYFGAAAAPDGETYYAFTVGDWQVIALDSELCGEEGDCDGSSEQERWLEQQLADDDRLCTIVYFHHPRFSSGRHGSDDTFDAIWRLMYEGDVEVVLAGHDHHYERFAPMRPDGSRDDDRGIRQFIVGTGGANLRSARETAANSEVRHWRSYGLLRLDLRADGYDWQFVVASGEPFEDSGSGKCH